MAKAHFLLMLGLTAWPVSPLHAQQIAPPPPGMVQPLKRAIVTLTPPDAPPLHVTTPGWPDGGDIPFANTQYDGNVVPGLNWTRGPARTRAYAIIMQDTDAVRNGVRKHALHWTMVNIPATMTSLPAAMAPDAKPAGSRYGPNYKGLSQPYLGPRTPEGPKHHYHIQVFALDHRIAATGLTDYDTLLDRMKGHVLASGEVIGLGRAPDAR